MPQGAQGPHTIPQGSGGAQGRRPMPPGYKAGAPGVAPSQPRIFHPPISPSVLAAAVEAARDGRTARRKAAQSAGEQAGIGPAAGGAAAAGGGQGAVNAAVDQSTQQGEGRVPKRARTANRRRRSFTLSGEVMGVTGQGGTVLAVRCLRVASVYVNVLNVAIIPPRHALPQSGCDVHGDVAWYYSMFPVGWTHRRAQPSAGKQQVLFTPSYSVQTIILCLLTPDHTLCHLSLPPCRHRGRILPGQ